MIDFLSYFMSI